MRLAKCNTDYFLWWLVESVCQLRMGQKPHKLSPSHVSKQNISLFIINVHLQRHHLMGESQGRGGETFLTRFQGSL